MWSGRAETPHPPCHPAACAPSRSAAPAFLDLFNPAATKAPSQAGSRGVGGSDALAAVATAEAVLGYEGEMWSRCLRCGSAVLMGCVLNGC